MTILQLLEQRHYGYFTTGEVTYLGQFQSSSFSSQDPDAVLQFCLVNDVNRTL